MCIARAASAQVRAALLQEAADGRIGLQADRPLIGFVGGGDFARARQQAGARRPIGLVIAQPRIVGQGVECRQTRGGAWRRPTSMIWLDLQLIGRPVPGAQAS